ncbi:MAG: hypothetical protein KIT34_16700 [Cyanobacteria bacterium TGS_CYA1]|nr:hypothetical protein [Cyanobacteria bacterium TGS_CYA1]
MFELSGFSIFGLITFILSSIHFAYRRLVLKKEKSRFFESLILIGFVLSTFVLYGASPFIHLFTREPGQYLEPYFVPAPSLHLGLIVIGLLALLLSLTPLYNRLLKKSKLVLNNWYAFALCICVITLIDLGSDLRSQEGSIGRAYDFQIRRGVNDYQMKEKFFDLNSDLVQLESWFRSSIWTPWIMLLILGSPNFRGLLKELSKKETSV